jgi:hypothetical protein
MTGGGWSPGPHFRADELPADKGLLKTKLKEIEARGPEIAAVNCSGNPLDPGGAWQKHRKEIKETPRWRDWRQEDRDHVRSAGRRARGHGTELVSLYQELACRDARTRPLPVGGLRVPTVS